MSGVSSTHRIAAFFGLDGITAAEQATPRTTPGTAPGTTPPPRFGGEVIAIGRDGQARLDGSRRPDPAAKPDGAASNESAGFDPGEVIRRALAAAGLMKR